jgi:hypothetical protein
MQKMEVTNFRNFCLKNSGISGLGEERNFRQSEFPELQSLMDTILHTFKQFNSQDVVVNRQNHKCCLLAYIF